MSQNLSSAAVRIGALRVKTDVVIETQEILYIACFAQTTFSESIMLDDIVSAILMNYHCECRHL